MNILFVFESPIIPNIGGVQRVTEVLTIELMKRGYGVFFLALGEGEYLNSYNFVTKQYYLGLNELGEITFKERFNKLLTDCSIDIVVVQNFNNLWITKYFNKSYKTISVFHIQPFYRDTFNRHFFYENKELRNRSKVGFVAAIFPKLTIEYFAYLEKKLWIHAFHHSDYICILSDRFRKRIDRRLKGFIEDKLVAIPNPNVVFENSDNVNEKKNVILWVGRINNNSKRALDFIKMWEILHKDLPTWECYMAGEGIDMNYNKVYIKRHHLPNIQLLGRVNDMSSLYEIAKLVCITSCGEGWGMSIIEGMSFKCVPCVYNNYESVYDIIEDNETGIITEPYPKKMAERLLEIARDDKRLAQMGISAQKSIRRFDVNLIVDKWEDLFHVVMGDGLEN